MEVIFDMNDNLLKVEGLRDDQAAAGVFLNAATLSADVKDEDDVLIVAVASLSYVTSSDGNYTGTIPDTTVFTKNTRGIVEITANAGVGLQGFWTLAFRVRTRDQ